MAEGALERPADASGTARSHLGTRFAVTLGLIVIAGIAYALLGAAGMAPMPRSLDSLAARHTIGHSRAFVSGYYVAQPFVSYGGPTLPPYMFASAASQGAPAVSVTPSLDDLHAGRIVAVIDTATGDGSRWSPYTIHSLMRADAFAGAAIVGALLLVVAAFAIAGPLSERLVRGR